MGALIIWLVVMVPVSALLTGLGKTMLIGILSDTHGLLRQKSLQRAFAECT
jgi:hypothetical protein